MGTRLSPTGDNLKLGRACDPPHQNWSAPSLTLADTAPSVVDNYRKPGIKLDPYRNGCEVGAPDGNFAESGRDFGESRPKFGRSRREFGPNRHEIGRARLRFGPDRRPPRSWPKKGQVRQNPAEHSSNRAQKLVDLSPNLVETTPNAVEPAPKLARPPHNTNGNKSTCPKLIPTRFFAMQRGIARHRIKPGCSTRSARGGGGAGGAAVLLRRRERGNPGAAAAILALGRDGTGAVAPPTGNPKLLGTRSVPFFAKICAPNKTTREEAASPDTDLDESWPYATRALGAKHFKVTRKSRWTTWHPRDWAHLRESGRSSMCSLWARPPAACIPCILPCAGPSPLVPRAARAQHATLTSHAARLPADRATRNARAHTCWPLLRRGAAVHLLRSPVPTDRQGTHLQPQARRFGDFVLFC